MSEEHLNRLFQEIREEKAETSVHDVQKWIALSAASVGLFGLLSKFKLPIYLTKKIIIMSTIAISVGIGATALILSAFGGNESTSQHEKTASTPFIGNNSEFASGKTFIGDSNTKLTSPNSDKMPENLLDIELLPFLPIEETPPNDILPPKTENIINSKSQNSEERNVTSFNRVSVGCAFQVLISQGSKQSVVLEGDEYSIGLIETEVFKNELRINFKTGIHNNYYGVKIYLTMTDIRGLKLEGAAQITSQNKITSKDLELIGKGAAQFELDVKCNKITIDGNGASAINLKGTAQNVFVKAEGASHIECYDLETNEINIEASGAAKVECKTKEKLFVKATGSANVSYKGNPVNISKQLSTTAKLSRRI